VRQLVIKSVQHYLMHGVTMKFIEAQGAFLFILECFNNSTFFNVVRVSW